MTAASCAVCGAPCRGRCGKCGARLCVLHKPKTPRSRCANCKSNSAAARPLPNRPGQALVTYPGQSGTRAPQPLLLPFAGSSGTPLSTLTLTDQLTWIDERRARLRKKQQRERDYLNRRAARGTHTPTDDAYEADAVLEDELLEALTLLETLLQSGGQSQSSGPGSGGSYAGNTSMLFADPDWNGKMKP